MYERTNPFWGIVVIGRFRILQQTTPPLFLTRPYYFSHFLQCFVCKYGLKNLGIAKCCFYANDMAWRHIAINAHVILTSTQQVKYLYAVAVYHVHSSGIWDAKTYFSFCVHPCVQSILCSYQLMMEIWWSWLWKFVILRGIFAQEWIRVIFEINRLFW